MDFDGGRGRVWSLVIIWPFAGVPLTLKFYDFQEPYAIWIQIGICVGWALFGYGVYRAYRLIKGS